MNAQQANRGIMLFLGLVLSSLNSAWAADDVAQLVDEMLAIQRDILGIEQQLEATVGDDRLVIYFDMGRLPFLEVDMMAVSINGEVVVSQSVIAKQREAFNAGAVQRLYVGALAPGQHHIKAHFEGYKRGPYVHEKNYLLEKNAGVDVVKLSIADVFHQQESEFSSYPEFIFRQEQLSR